MVRDYTAFLPADAIACLKLAANGRRFPFRPLTNGLFLIGSGPSCDLRLGESGIPSLHSRIEISGKTATISCIGDNPGLFINGQPAVSARLADGDLIEIGDFRAVFQFCQSATMPAQGTGLHSDVLAGTGMNPAMISGSVEVRPAVAAERSLDRGVEMLQTAAGRIGAGLGPDTLPLEDFVQLRRLAGKTSEPVPAEILFRIEGLDQRLTEASQVLRDVIRQQQLIAATLQGMAHQLELLRGNVTITGNPYRASA